MPFSPEMQQRIIDALNAKDVESVCPRCGTNSWTLVDGYMSHPLSDNLRTLVIGGRALPTIAVICNHCGYLAEHAAVTLGVLDPSPNTDQRDSAPAEDAKTADNSEDATEAAGNGDEPPSQP
jgi:hypothetical protein